MRPVPAALFVLFAGAWSDHNGRKPLLAAALAGWIFSTLVHVANLVWFNELRAEWLMLENLQVIKTQGLDVVRF